MIMYITARGPKLCAALVSLRIATNADVQSIQVKEAVLKKLIYKKKHEYRSLKMCIKLYYLVYITWSSLDIVAYHCQKNSNR
jgi:hypothetical protein